MSTLYNIEVTQGTNKPELEPDVYNYETLLFYLNRFEIYEDSPVMQRLLNGEKVLIGTYKNDTLSIKIVEYIPLSENQQFLVKGLKYCSIAAAIIALLILFFFNNFKALLILLPNAALLFLTSKKLSQTSSKDFEKQSKVVLITLAVAMIIMTIVSITALYFGEGLR